MTIFKSLQPDIQGTLLLLQSLIQNSRTNHTFSSPSTDHNLRLLLRFPGITHNPLPRGRIGRLPRCHHERAPKLGGRQVGCNIHLHRSGARTWLPTRRHPRALQPEHNLVSRRHVQCRTIRQVRNLLRILYGELSS